MRLDELGRGLRERLDALGPAPRSELLHVLMLPDFERAARIGEFWGYPESRAFAELLIDYEEDRTLRAVLAATTLSEHPDGNERYACSDYHEAARPDVRDSHARPDPDEVRQKIAPDDHHEEPEGD
jgi:hypothetical protein